MRKLSLIQRLAFAAFAACPLVVAAQTPFAGEDFDEGATNGGFTATTMVFTPDLSSNTTFRNAFGGSRFDRFGEVSRLDGPGAFPSNEGLPFGLRDDSVPGNPQSFEGDVEGFVAADKLDDFVVSVDTVNGDNPNGDGSVAAEWTFDVTGRSNLGLSMDFGMLGDFEEDDIYSFTYSIDGGSSLPAFSITGESGTFYSYTMDDGTFVDRFENGFFDETEWFDLVDFGPNPGVIDYHPDDTGMDGDATAQDGFVPVEFADGVEEVRALMSGTFNDLEFEPVKDPLVVTSGDGELVSEIIPADFTTFSTALQGAGSTLTLRLDGVSNGGDEWFAFDNILLSELPATTLAGDYNDDGTVDAADYVSYRDALEGGGSLANETESLGTVDGDDLQAWKDNYGAASGSAVAIPEPTALVLAALAAAGLAGRRLS